MRYVFFLFCFLNLYAPVSANITFAFDILLFVYVNSKTDKIIIERGAYKFVPWVLLFISIMAVYFTREPKTDYTVIGTYLRMLVNCIVFPSIIVFFLRKKVDVLQILSLVLVLHCTMVLIQLAVPSLQELNALLFRFERDVEILEFYSFRRLGLTGGFDLSALYAVLSVVLALEDYLINSRRISLFVFLISFLASLFTSRTGMVVSAIAVVTCIQINYKRMKGRVRFVSLITIVVASLAVFYFILPIVLTSFDINYGSRLSGLEDQYDTETFSYLSNYHLNPLDYLNTRELFWGYGCSVSKTERLWHGSDIGYIRQIYHVGLIGVALIIYFCYRCVYLTNKRCKKYRKNSKMILGRQLMWLLLIIYIVFNYKNELMYSICSFEVFLIIYWVMYYYSDVYREKIVI